ncbi:hypothetical protein EG328_002059 [Venturia inaequalis]|nr:hypothetical protein EG328_002059 [Venturia inaequalis]
MRLAEACPGLKDVQIQGATKLTDGAVWAFLANCPLLTRLEVSSHYKRKIRLEGGFFTSLQHRVDLATELEILRVDGNVPYGGTNRFATAMRALSKARETLLIEISHTSEDSQYYWGDGRSYFMTVSDDKFKKGRKL